MKKQNESNDSNLDVLLVNPPFSRLKGAHYMIYFHLNIGYLASALRTICNLKVYNAEDPLCNEKEGSAERRKKDLSKQHFDLFDSSKNYKNALESDSHAVWNEVKDVFLKYRPKIVGISCMSAKYPSALKIARIYKNFFPEGTVILGGQHPTIRAEEVLSSGDVDFAVRGEGEEIVTELVRLLLKGPVKADDLVRIRGISFRQGNSVIHTEDRSPSVDLDRLSFPARDLLIKPLHDKTAYGAIITSRGCAFDCVFCSAKSVVGRKVRCRSVQNVVDEIKDVKDKYKVRNFFFWDDTFTVNRNRAVELCRAIRKLGISWACTTRVDMVDYGLLKEMRKAGCVSIDYGVESGSERMLAKISKNITRTRIDKAISETIKAGIIPNAFLMVGFPDETEDDIRDTIAFARSTKAFSIAFSNFTPYPGTSLFERSNELGLIKNDFDWSDFSHNSFVNYFTQCVSYDKFHSLLNELIAAVDAHNASLYKKIRRVAFIARSDPRHVFKKATGRLCGILNTK